MLGSLVLSVALPALLLIGLTYLLASRRLHFSATALSLMARQHQIWMAGIIGLVAAAAIKALAGSS